MQFLEVLMLGVLAIIGVLSVGAIAGYSKAMMKYKLNKSVEQINLLFNLTYRYLFEFKFDDSMINNHTPLLPYFKALGEIPEDMIRQGDNSYIYDKLNDRIKIYINKASHSETIFEIYRSKGNATTAKEICLAVMTMAQEFYDSIIYVQLKLNTLGKVTNYKGGKLKANYNNYQNLKEENFMQKCTEGQDGSLTVYIYFSNRPDY